MAKKGESGWAECWARPRWKQWGEGGAWETSATSLITRNCLNETVSARFGRKSKKSKTISFMWWQATSWQIFIIIIILAQISNLSFVVLGCSAGLSRVASPTHDLQMQLANMFGWCKDTTHTHRQYIPYDALCILRYIHRKMSVNRHICILINASNHKHTHAANWYMQVLPPTDLRKFAVVDLYMTRFGEAWACVEERNYLRERVANDHPATPCHLASSNLGFEYLTHTNISHVHVRLKWFGTSTWSGLQRVFQISGSLCGVRPTWR